MKKLFIVLIILHSSLQIVYSQSGWYILNTGLSRTSLYSLYFINENTGYVVGHNGTIIKTTNGGVNWIIQQSNNNNDFKGVYFIDSNVGYIVGYNSTFLKTTNGGNLWNN